MPKKGTKETAGLDREALMAVYGRLLARFGPQGWWPGETPFEVCVGAILVQNASWANAARAIANLKDAGLLSAEGLRRAPAGRLAELVRPARFFNVKAGRLKAFARFLRREHGGSLERLFDRPAEELREVLLDLDGIGPETADSIVLYAAGKPAFVVDAYTRRILSRLGLFRPKRGGRAGYEALQAVFTRALPEDTALWNEYHALLVRLGNTLCRPRPRCAPCPLREVCAHAKGRPGG